MPESTNLPIISFDPEAYDSVGNALSGLAGFVVELSYFGRDGMTAVLLERVNDDGMRVRRYADGFPTGDAFDVAYTAIREVRVP